MAHAPGILLWNSDNSGRTACISLSPIGTVAGFPIEAGEKLNIPLKQATTLYFWTNGPEGEMVHLRLFTDDGN